MHFQSISLIPDTHDDLILIPRVEAEIARYGMNERLSRAYTVPSTISPIQGRYRRPGSLPALLQTCLTRWLRH